MSEHSPTPWTLDTTLCVVWDRNKRCVLRWESGSKAEWIAEMEFIVKCVNLHDDLVKFLEKLRPRLELFTVGLASECDALLAKAKGEA